MLTIPKLIVKKIMGWMKSLTRLMKIPEKSSLKVGPKDKSVPNN
jgi:hypothetical protein